ncbi:MAG: FtsX-like permease family protein [Bacteroidales bacterium]|nr:FtsX-like permease family protein [Bacteroidales bacterium]
MERKMNAAAFISRKLRFKGKTAMVSIAVSFLVMILAVSISSGFRKELRDNVSAISGDIQITSSNLNYVSEDSPISSIPPSLDAIRAVEGVKSIEPAIYRAGIVKKDDNIHGVLFKGVNASDSTSSLQVSIPSKLSDLLGVKEGDELIAYFVGERVKMRKFKVASIYRSLVEADDNLLVYASLSDLQRLNSWEQDEVSALEITLADNFRSRSRVHLKTDEIGTLALLMADAEDDDLIATPVTDKYSRIFDWLDLIDLNVMVILILMTVVAGFNMISGLLILLFQNISTIGILKSMGMTDRSISELFLRVSSALVLKGMAIGNILALLFCALQSLTHFIRLNPENYFISFVPVSVNVPMILLADLLAYVAIMLLLLLPTLFISKVDPAQTVRAQ